VFLFLAMECSAGNSALDIANLEDMLATSLSLEDNNPTTAENILSSIANYFRELRGVCAKGKVYQDAVAESNIIKHSTEIIQKLLNDPRSLQYERVLVCIRVGVQFLGNFVVDNDRSKHLVWHNYRLMLRYVFNFPCSNNKLYVCPLKVLCWILQGVCMPASLIFCKQKLKK
jgi:hypothetical protein